MSHRTSRTRMILFAVMFTASITIGFGLGWAILYRLEIAEAHAPAVALWLEFLIGSAAVAALAALLGGLAAIRIARPPGATTEGAGSVPGDPEKNIPPVDGAPQTMRVCTGQADSHEMQDYFRSQPVPPEELDAFLGMQTDPADVASVDVMDSEHEAERLAALLRYELLDTPSEAEFDELTQLAAQICGTPVALMSLVDSARQWFKSRVNFDGTETPREISFCGHAIQGSDVFEVPNAAEDPRFRDNPLVTGAPHVTFYAGAPLVSHDGFRLGTLCVIDHVPKQLTQTQRGALVTLSRQAMRLIEHHAMARELRKKQGELTAITDASPLGMFRTDARHDCLYINKKYTAITGLDLEQAAGRGWVAAVHPADRARLVAAQELAALRNTEYLNIQRFVRPDGTARLCRVAGAPIIADGVFTGFAGTVEDITERQGLNEALAESEKRLRTITDNLPVLITYIDRETRVRFANATLEAWMGIAPSMVRDRRFEDVFGNALYAERRQHIDRALQGERVEFDMTSIASGVERHLRAVYIPDRGPNGVVNGFYTLTTDVTTLKVSEQRLGKLVRLDALTELPNRYFLNELLIEAVARSRRANTRLAILYLDIDHFKEINDTYGHQTGDAVLIEFAARLTECVRAQDTVARLSGDEFVIVLEGVESLDEPQLAATRVGEITARPWRVGGHVMQVSTSVGIACDYAGSPNAADLLEIADRSLYEAKREGRNRFRLAASTT